MAASSKITVAALNAVVESQAAQIQRLEEALEALGNILGPQVDAQAERIEALEIRLDGVKTWAEKARDAIKALQAAGPAPRNGVRQAPAAIPEPPARPMNPNLKVYTNREGKTFQYWKDPADPKKTTQVFVFGDAVEPEAPPAPTSNSVPSASPADECPPWEGF